MRDDACVTLRDGDIDAFEVVGYPGRVDVCDEMIGTGGMNSLVDVQWG